VPALSQVEIVKDSKAIDLSRVLRRGGGIQVHVRPKSASTLESHPLGHSLAGEAGLSLIEVLISLTLLALSAMASMAVISSASNLDAEVAERRIALRAAQALIQEVTNYDYGDDVTQFVDHWSAAENRAVAVPDLPTAGEPAPSVSETAITVSQGGSINYDENADNTTALLSTIEQQDWASSAIESGRAVVAIDDSDAERIVVAVRVRWGEGARMRSMDLRTVLSEIRP
jgi:hypothetical protein